MTATRRKPKVLFLNEFSQLGSGFSTYGAGVLPFLYESDLFEIAELGTYVHADHPKIKEVPWKVYANDPPPNSPPELLQRFYSTPLDQFGRATFDSVCLDFQPDHVITIRDPWMDQWIAHTAFRKCFNWLHMPTCDGEPQKVEWLSDYEDCEVLCTYSEWAKQLLMLQTNNRLKVRDVCSPGADTETFKPAENKNQIKEQLGFPADSIIIQTVMRNQPRKLYPDILKCFRLFLQKCKDENRQDLADKTYLHFHTTHPDVGWDMAEEIRKYNLSNKVFFTYMCDSCGHWEVRRYTGEICICPKCQAAPLKFPTTARGLDRENLALVMSAADVYIQLSICEGWGMPIQDAKACGVPCLVTNYSAMIDHANNGGALPIENYKLLQESIHQTYQLRAVTNLEDACNKIFKLVSDDNFRHTLGQEARKTIVDNYTWKTISEKWIKILKETPVKPGDPWRAPFKEIKPKTQIPQGLDNHTFVHWLYKEVLMQPDKAMSYHAQKLRSILDMGFEASETPDKKPIRVPVNQDNVMKNKLDYIRYVNAMNYQRYDKLVRGGSSSNNKGIMAVKA